MRHATKILPLAAALFLLGSPITAEAERTSWTGRSTELKHRTAYQLRLGTKQLEGHASTGRRYDTTLHEPFGQHLAGTNVSALNTIIMREASEAARKLVYDARGRAARERAETSGPETLEVTIPLESHPARAVYLDGKYNRTERLDKAQPLVKELVTARAPRKRVVRFRSWVVDPATSERIHGIDPATGLVDHDGAIALVKDDPRVKSAETALLNAAAKLLKVEGPDKLTTTGEAEHVFVFDLLAPIEVVSHVANDAPIAP